MYWYHSLASSIKIRGIHLTIWFAAKLNVHIQSKILSKCSSGASSGFSEHSGLKYDLFIAVCACNTSCGSTGGAGGTMGCCGWIGSCGGTDGFVVCHSLFFHLDQRAVLVFDPLLTYPMNSILFWLLIVPLFLPCVSLLFLLCGCILLLTSFCDAIKTTASSFLSHLTVESPFLFVLLVYIRKSVFSTCEMSWCYSWRELGWASMVCNSLVVCFVGMNKLGVRYITHPGLP